MTSNAVAAAPAAPVVPDVRQPRVARAVRGLCATAIGCAATAVLTACGGGGGGARTPDATGAVPAQAFSSVAAFTRFIASLAPDERVAPLAMPADAMAPTSETDDPLPLT